MKSLVFYSGMNQQVASDLARAELAPLPFMETVYETDERPHSVSSVPCVVLDIDGYLYREFRVGQIIGGDIATEFDAAPDTYTPPAPPPTEKEVLLAKDPWAAKDRDAALKILLRSI